MQQQPKSSTDTVINSEPIETEPALVRADSMKDRVCEEKKENAADGVDVIQKAYQTNAANKGQCNVVNKISAME